ncbi:MAG TPA: bifunctional hydroxymethylpyrimidine kinase/phosphomethylpyrimidine kinase [Tepidisphaeraceae bacterium]|jgi:hydroxymethylpyrimidine/phosphomethylpyrimidine kinase|nr:bifunctional hydroxymethylpyrimidine kinase/phosphomethylpyrimidine kinase [Tepidisphaeraceae bacterium]
MKTALTIAGSDSSGGAGIQADLKVFSVLGVYGMSAITAVTAQNTLGVKDAAEISTDLIRKQIDVTAGDIQVDATKTGMLSSEAIIELVEDAIKRNNLQPYVCDPVMVSKVGSELLKKDAINAMKKRLLPLATVITPNLREVAALTGIDPGRTTIAVAKDEARRFALMGVKAVVIKNIQSDDQSVDLLFDGKEFTEFAAKTQPSEKTHGSGCAFSAAITAGLANRMSLVEAIDQAKQLVNMAIQYSDGQGRGTAPVNVLAWAPKKK